MRLLGASTDRTYPEETNKVMALQVTCLRVGELGPYLLEGTHFFSGDRLGAAGHLEDVVETLHDHTSE